MLAKSISKRKGKVAIAVIAVIMGASVTTALLTVSLDINEKMNYEFRKFGANLLVVPESDSIDIGIGQFGFGAVTEQRAEKIRPYQFLKISGNTKLVACYAGWRFQIMH